jgi:hypothetical protein
MADVLLSHCWNLYSELAVEAMESVPESNHWLVAVGAVEPAAVGVANMVSWCWVFQFAVAVFDLSIVIGLLLVKSVPDAFPVQLVKTYCVPVGPGTVLIGRVA